MRSKGLLHDTIQVHVRNADASARIKVRNISEYKHRNDQSTIAGYIIELGERDLLQQKWWAHFRIQITYGDVIELDPFHMANEETVSRRLAEHRRLGIVCFALRQL